MAVCIANVTAAVDDVSRDALDSVRSKATFSVRMMLLVTVDGRFGKIRGDIRRNPFRDEISVDAHIDATSVTMNNHVYEGWVRSAEFFDVDKYPDIEFSSEPIPAQRLDKGGALPGMLTLRGVRKPVTFMLEAADCARPGVECAVRVRGGVRRSEFEMRSKPGVLGDKVQLAFDVFVKPAIAR